MAIGVSSVIGMKVFYAQRGQVLMNHFHFRVVALESGSVVSQPTNLARGFGVQFMALNRLWQSNALTYDRCEVEELNGTAIGVAPYSPGIVGAVAQEAMGPFVAVSVQKVRFDRTTRHGWIRLPGLPETSQVNGVINAPIVNQINDAIQGSLMPEGAPVLRVVQINDEGDDSTWVDLRLIIWGGNSPAFPLGRYQDVSALDVKNETSTQNTRKVGRGI